MHFFCFKPGGKHGTWSSWVHKRYFETFSLPKPLVSVSWLGKFCRCFGQIQHSVQSSLPLCSSDISFLQSHLRWIRKMLAVSGVASVWIFYLSLGKQKQQLSRKIWKRAKCHFGSKASLVAKGERSEVFLDILLDSCWRSFSSSPHLTRLWGHSSFGEGRSFQHLMENVPCGAPDLEKLFLRKMLS